MNKKVISFMLILAIVILTFAPIAEAASNRLLYRGSRGSDVKTLQQRLNNLGYNAGKADGIFGSRTYNAVKAFQRKHGLAVDGIVGRNTRNILFSGSTKPSRGETSNKTTSTPITSLLRRGSRGSQVTTLQKRLNQLGYNAGKADGIFGTRTYNAVKAFQRGKGLVADGIVGKNTINKLYPKSTSKPTPKPNPQPKPTEPQHKPPVNNVPITQTLRKGSRGSQVTTLQKRLNQLGYNAGKADGIFGTRTYNAVKAFQRGKGLAADGIVGKNTINKLYPPKDDSGLDDFVPFEVKAGSLKGKTVIIDAGHGGSDSGATRNGYKEKDFTFDMAKRLEGMLKKAGAEVIMTRSSDVARTLQYRGNVANIKILDEEIKRVSAEISELEKEMEAVNVKSRSLETTQNSLSNIEGNIQENEAELEKLNIELNELNAKIEMTEGKIKEEKETEIEIEIEEVEYIEKIDEEEIEESKQEELEKEKVKELEINEEELERLKTAVEEIQEKITTLTLENDEKIEGKKEIVQNITRLNSKESDSKDFETRLAKLKDELEELKNLKSNVSKYTGKDRLKPADKNLVNIFDRSKDYNNIIFISIHNNSTSANNQTSASGIRVYYRPTIVSDNQGQTEKVYYNGYNDNGRKLFAQMLNEEMQSKSVFSRKTTKLYNTNDLAVLREQNLVSALVEVGFMNNPNDLALLRRQQTREDIAAGMFNGIGKYFATVR